MWFIRKHITHVSCPTVKERTSSIDQGDKRLLNLNSPIKTG